MASTDSSKVQIPKTWPGAFGLYKYSRDAVMFNLGTILWLIGATLLTSIVFGGGKNPSTGRDASSLLADLINVWFTAGLIVTFLAGVKSTKIEFVDALKKGGSLYLRYLGLSILTVVILFVSALLLIVPFFFVLPRIALASYYLVDKDLGPIEALQASWDGTKGHSGKVWGIIGVSILMAILILVLVGLYFLLMYSAAYALLYTYIQKTK